MAETAEATAVAEEGAEGWLRGAPRPIEPGMEHTAEFTITWAQHLHYTECSGDDNPNHTGGAGSLFGEQSVVHGMNMLGMVGAILGTEFPGPSTALMKICDVRSLNPMYPGDTAVVTIVVGWVRERKNGTAIAGLNVSCEVLDRSPNERLVLKGELVVTFWT